MECTYIEYMPLVSLLLYKFEMAVKQLEWIWQEISPIKSEIIEWGLEKEERDCGEP